MSGTTIEYAYRPQGPALERYIESTVQRTFIMGPLGSGKTNASCWKCLRIMRGQAPDAQGVRRTRILAVRNTYSDLFSTTIKDWLEMAGDLGEFTKGGREPPTHRLRFRLQDGTRVEAEMVFLALDRDDHVAKVRGYQLTAAWLNETKELSYSIVSMLDLRVGRYPKAAGQDPTWYGIFGDTNAPDTDHWYHRLAEEIRPKGWLFLRQPGGVMRLRADAPWQVNPGAENVTNLPRDYYINGVEGKTDIWIQVNLANEYGFVSDGKPVYPDYRDSVHCKPFELIPNLPLYIGLDFGLTPAAWIAQRTAIGQWRVRYELCTKDTGVVRFANQLKLFLADHCRGFKIAQITGDPAGDQRQPGDNEERTVFQILEANGVKAEPAPFNNDFTIRTEAQAVTLRRMIDGEPGFLLHPDCKVSRKGFQGGYKFRRMQIAGEDRYTEEPVKNSFSHPMEAGQYLLLGAGEGNAVLEGSSVDREKDAAGYRAKRGLAANDEEAALAALDASEARIAAAYRRKRGLR